MLALDLAIFSLWVTYHKCSLNAQIECISPLASELTYVEHTGSASRPRDFSEQTSQKFPLGANINV